MRLRVRKPRAAKDRDLDLIHAGAWERDPLTPLMEHVDGVPWWNAEAPPWRHLHLPQTRGWIKLDFVERCRCGATRISPFRTWVPERRPRVRQPTRWQRFVMWLDL
jgi:hypothetical protein